MQDVPLNSSLQKDLIRLWLESGCFHDFCPLGDFGADVIGELLRLHRGGLDARRQQSVLDLADREDARNFLLELHHDLARGAGWREHADRVRRVISRHARLLDNKAMRAGKAVFLNNKVRAG